MTRRLEGVVPSGFLLSALAACAILFGGAERAEAGAPALWNGGPGPWSDPSRWNPFGVPNGPFDVLIDGGNFMPSQVVFDLPFANVDNIFVDPGDELIVAPGTIKGKGTVTANVNSAGGKVAPGESPGVLTFDGDFIQDAASTLEIEIGGLVVGTEHDQLVVTGNVTLDGTLDLLPFGGFAPAPGNQFQVLTYASRSGTFSQITGQSAGAGLWYFPDYNATDLTLLVSPLLLGDANNDGTVTADDLVAIQQNFGTAGPADGLLLGDADDNGTVTADDLIAVQQNFGAALGGVTAAVPEPSTVAACLGGLLCAGRRREERR